MRKEGGTITKGDQFGIKKSSFSLLVIVGSRRLRNVCMAKGLKRDFCHCCSIKLEPSHWTFEKTTTIEYKKISSLL